MLKLVNVEKTLGGKPVLAGGNLTVPPGQLTTVIGGSGMDGAHRFADDSDRTVVLGGFTHSADFPTTPGAFMPVAQNAGNAFVTRLAPDGSSLEWSTRLGGEWSEQAYAVVLDDQDDPIALLDQLAVVADLVDKQVRRRFGGQAQRRRLRGLAVPAEARRRRHDSHVGAAALRSDAHDRLPGAHPRHLHAQPASQAQGRAERGPRHVPHRG